MANLKEKIKKLIEAEKQRLGSYSAVATKCKVSEATITLVMQDKYPAKDEAMLDKIAYALDYEDDNSDGWVYVPISITKSVVKLIGSAKQKSLFVAISEKAGGGKSGSLKYYMRNESQEGNYYLRCREWGLGVFLMQLCRTLGIEIPSGKMSNDDLGELVFEYFNRRKRKKPQLLLDEFNKLKPAARRFLIPLFNETEGFLSVVTSGTEDYKRELEDGVKLAHKGCDELVSRLGGKFIGLTGATFTDAKAIFSANGVTDTETQRKYFDECSPTQVLIEDRNINVVKDIRRIKRITQRHQLLNQTA